jgi:hypothetical protein
MKHVWALALFLATTPAIAETVEVKYLGPVDLETYECREITRSSFVNRLCFDPIAKRMVVLLKSTYYSYCQIPATIVADFLNAESMGRFYNQKIKSSAAGGTYDCRDQ